MTWPSRDDAWVHTVRWNDGAKVQFEEDAKHKFVEPIRQNKL